MSEPPLTIGRLARAAGVHVETVRYYQRIGLVAQPPRPLGGVRRYPEGSVERIVFVKRAQQLGFSLAEIRELLALGDGHCADVRARAEEKRRRVTERIGELEALRHLLDRLIAACLAGHDEAHCPIVETLAGSPERGVGHGTGHTRSRPEPGA